MPGFYSWICSVSILYTSTSVMGKCKGRCVAMKGARQDDLGVVCPMERLVCGEDERFGDKISGEEKVAGRTRTGHQVNAVRTASGGS